MESQIISRAMDFVRGIFEGDFGGHDYLHTLRVYNTAVMLAQCEGADVSVVGLAALLHDVDDKKLSPETSEGKLRAVGFLRENGVKEEKISWICRIIGEVSFSQNRGAKPETLESQCVQDADRLDALGAIGIARTFAFGGSKGRPVYSQEFLESKASGNEDVKGKGESSLEHFYDKLLLLKDMMNTSTAKSMAEKRHKFMEAFLKEFYEETMI